MLFGRRGDCGEITLQTKQCGIAGRNESIVEIDAVLALILEFVEMAFAITMVEHNVGGQRENQRPAGRGRSATVIIDIANLTENTDPIVDRCGTGEFQLSACLVVSAGDARRANISIGDRVSGS